jgi:lysophospholipase L1-like esterase
MRKIIFLIISLLIISCENMNDNQPVKIVFLGDSITQQAEDFEDGFISLIRQNLVQNKFELVGKGISGNKVSDLLTRYKSDVIDLNPDIVFIYIGINDVWHKYDFGTGSDIDLYEKGLRTIISDIKSLGSKIVLCTPTVIGENTGDFVLGNQFKDVETMEKMNGDLDTFSEVVRKLSNEYKTELLDLRKIFMDYLAENNINNDAAGILTTDVVHLNKQGNKLIADQMIKFIN